MQGGLQVKMLKPQEFPEFQF